MQFCLFVKWEFSDLGNGMYACHLEIFIENLLCVEHCAGLLGCKYEYRWLLVWNRLQSYRKTISIGMNMSAPIGHLTSTLAFCTRQRLPFCRKPVITSFSIIRCNK